MPRRGLCQSSIETNLLSLTSNADKRIREAIAILAGQYCRAIGSAAQVEPVEWGNLLQPIRPQIRCGGPYTVT